MNGNRTTVEGVLQMGLGIMSLFGYGVPRNYIGGMTALISGLEALFAQPHEVGSVAVKPTAETTQAAS
ncbi:MAG: hypothetical protein H7843_10045 [Nitrospirota bacterium]